MKSRSSSIRNTLVLLAFGAAAVFVVQFQQHQNEHENGVMETLSHRRLLETSSDSEILAEMTKVLTTPREFVFEEARPNRFEKHQFLHLHHMKTGGTSVDYYLRCAMNRIKSELRHAVPYASIHECGESFYQKCRSGENIKCQEGVANASIMSYCAPLKDLPAFDWNEPPTMGAITVLRHPVDRVWSMFRFQTKDCYKCMTLLDIYDKIDSGDLTDLEPICYKQLQNHEVANLLSSEWPEDAPEEAMVQEAVDNMKSFFTMIGLTEQLNATITMASQVWPFMKPQVEWSKRGCRLSHANSSPKNNMCGENNTHWDLPSHPDEETRAAIEKHNQQDLKLYAAAVQHFELQKRAADFDEEAI